MQLIEKRAILQVFSDERILIGCDTHTHIKDNIGMLKITDDHKFFHEVLFMTVLSSLQVILDGYQLTNVLSLIDLTETALTD